MRKAVAGGLVYSTESGRMCPACRKPVAVCVCKSKGESAGPGDGIVRVSLESKGRGGKSVTVVRGLNLEAVALAELGKRLRAGCGTGGTTKRGILELQGDHRYKVTDLLKQAGLQVKQAGGLGIAARIADSGYKA